MADEPEEIEVEINDDKKPAAETKPDKTGDTPPVEVAGDGKDQPREIVTPEEGVDKLKANLEAAQRERDEEARKRREAEAKAADAGKQVQDAELREVTGAIEIITRDLDTAKASYKAARAANDVDAEIAATEALSDAKAKLNALEAGKAAIEQRNKQPQPRQAPSSDPVEALAANLEGQGWGRAGAWVRAHPEYARNPGKYREMVAASELAIARGAAVETDDYFRRVEETLGLNGQQQHQTTTVTKTNEPSAEAPMSQASRPVAPPAAPVSRNGNGAGGSKPGTVRLTRAQAEAAEFSFPDVPKAEAYRLYAKNMQASN